MVENNQFGLKPGVYEHYEKGELYKVVTIVNYRRHSNGLWIPMADPIVCYEHLEAQYDVNPKNPGTKTMVHKGFQLRLSEFVQEVKLEGGKTVKRFKPV